MNDMKPTRAKYTYTIPNHFSSTVYDYLRANHDYSSRLISAVIKDGQLLLNGNPVKFKTACAPMDIIEVILPGEYPDAESADLPVDVIYEDEDIILLNKPPGMVVHPTKSHQTDTLAGAIYNHWAETGFIGKVRFVNRIDRDTSGLVLGAKNKYVHHFIQNQFSADSTQKTYFAIVKGRPPAPSGEIDAPIGREEPMSMVRVVREDARASVTLYEIDEEFPAHCLLKLKLLTGRTHQIRVHLKYIGCPVISDSIYNPEENAYMRRQALHAYQIGFIHPRSKEAVLFTAPFADDFAEALKLLRKENQSLS